LEGRGFRDRSQSFADKKAVILGISTDKPKANARFAKLFDFEFPLLSDVDRAISVAYQPVDQRLIEPSAWAFPPMTRSSRDPSGEVSKSS